MPIEFGIRSLELNDINPLEEMERICFPDPYTAGLWMQEWNNALSYTFVAIAVAESHGPEIIGYLNFWLVSDEAQLHRLAVKREYRRSGIAGGLLAYLFGALRKMSVKSVQIEVRASNLSAIGCYEKYGFIIIGRRRGYYGGSDEDALLLEASVVETAGNDDEDIMKHVAG